MVLISRFAAGNRLATIVAIASSFFLMLLLAAKPASAQNYQVIVYFSGGSGGIAPGAATVDRFGNVYAPTAYGGFTNNLFCMQQGGCGTVWKFYTHGSSWLGDELYRFTGEGDGFGPTTAVAVAQSGVVYGGLFGNNNGAVYQLRPSATRASSAIAPWNDTTIFSGSRPTGYLAVDAGGNVYGTSVTSTSNGMVFELSPTQGGGYMVTTLYTFQGGADGASPNHGVLLDPVGNLYGTTSEGGSFNCGTVFELSNNGSGWTKTTLYDFQGGIQGCQPTGPLTRDSAGNLYGGNSGSTSTVYELSPQNGGWTFSVLQSFQFGSPIGSVAVDSAGNIYGTTALNIFKLMPEGGNWTYSSVHDFGCNGIDGCNPEGVTIDSNGNLFGATETGGVTNMSCESGCGTIWEITP